MSDFHDYIKNAFKPDHDMQIPDQAWDEFMDYSNARQSKPKGMLYWLVPVLLALLFLSNIFWWNYSERKIENLLSETVVRDTVYITEIITKEIVTEPLAAKREYNVSSLQSGPNVQVIRIPTYAMPSRFVLPEYKESLTVSKTSLLNHSFAKDWMSDSEAGVQVLTGDGQRNKTPSLTYLEGIGLSTSHFNYDRSAPGIPIYIRNQDYSEKSFLEKIRPKTFSLYGQTGIAFSSGLQIGSFSGIGSTLGFTSSFSRRLRAVVGLGYQSLKFSTYEYLDPQVLEHINEPENMQLEKITARRQKLLINANLEYSIYTKSRLRPFLGVGLTYGSSTLKNVEYKFVGAGGTIEFYLPDFDAEKLLLLGPSIGTDINLFDKLDARINLNMKYRLSGIEHTGLYSLQTGLYWHF